MSLGSSILDGEFAPVGINKVNIDAVCKKWDDRFAISSWHDDEYRIFATRKGGKSYLFKITISNEQANEIISRLGLYCISHPTFVNAKTYRKM